MNGQLVANWIVGVATVGLAIAVLGACWEAWYYHWRHGHSAEW